jgi:ABC-type uncharacterized transport system permease subunit
MRLPEMKVNVAFALAAAATVSILLNSWVPFVALLCLPVALFVIAFIFGVAYNRKLLRLHKSRPQPVDFLHHTNNSQRTDYTVH